jgi:serine/threonine-protein kinase
LEYAHQQGVIHRDIKPENILLHAGRPLVADFGIALAVSAAAGGRMTETGMSLGTPHYMSPEQATAEKDLTNRSDIYSLATVLYEMLTGEPPHLGNSAQQIILKIVTDTPRPVTELRKSVPPNVTAAVSKALERLAADRFETSAGFADALNNPAFTAPTAHASAVGAPAGRATPPWAQALHWGLTAVLGVSLVALGVKQRDRSATQVLRFTVPLGQGIHTPTDTVGPLALPRIELTLVAFSPDGQLVLYNAEDFAGTRRLYRQRVDQDHAEPIAEPEGVVGPFFAPDGEWFGVVDVTTGPWTLRRISVDGSVETIAQLPAGNFWGATWGDDETIVASVIRGDSSRLYQVPASGGEWEVLAEAEQPQNGYVVYSQPHMLPGSKALLVQSRSGADPEQAEIVAVDVATGNETPVLSNAMDPRYVPTGHLLFMRQGTLLAIGFDPSRLEVRGEPVTMIEDVMHAVFMGNTGLESGAAQVAVSAAGHLAYARGGVRPEPPIRVMRMTPAGDTVPLGMDPRRYVQLRVSPDGSKLAYTVGPGSHREIWVRDLARGVQQRLPTGGFANWPLEWSPDGRSLVFSSDRDQANKNIYRLAADGSGEPKRLAESDRPQLVGSVSSDGVIAYLEDGDIWVLPPDGAPRPFFMSDAFEAYPTFSPNGRFLAFTSNVSGRDEVYVRPYPGPEPAIPISPDGGSNVAWSRDGRQIYYVLSVDSPPRRVLMAVDVRLGNDLQFGRAVSLIDPWRPAHYPVRGYDELADGSFLAQVLLDGDRDAWIRRNRATEVHVIWNFFEELNARVGRE